MVPCPPANREPKLQIACEAPRNDEAIWKSGKKKNECRQLLEMQHSLQHVFGNTPDPPLSWSP